jgi:hypothetical protein
MIQFAANSRYPTQNQFINLAIFGCKTADRA